MEELKFDERQHEPKHGQGRDYPHIKHEELDLELKKEEERLMHLQEDLSKTKKQIRNWLHLMG